MKQITADTDILQEAKYWEEHFPGKGQALVELLAPFYEIKEGWEKNQTPFPIKRGLRATASLKKRCQQAICWRPWQGLAIYQDWDSLGGSLWYSLWYSLGDSLVDILEYSLGGSLGGSLWCSLFYACGFLITGDEKKTQSFRELLGLWAEGIIPLGFDKQGRLLIYSPPAE